MRARSVYQSARSVPWTGEKTLALTEDKTWQAMIKAQGHQNPPFRPRSRTAGFWGAIVGLKNLATPAHFILSPRPMQRMNEESPNCRETSPRTILFSTNRDHRREKRHTIKGSLAEHPKKKDKHNGSAMRAWWRSNSRRNCHLRIKCPQLNVLAALMRKWPLNNAALVAATHRRFGKAAVGTSTREVTCMINKWRAKFSKPHKPHKSQKPHQNRPQNSITAPHHK